MAVSTHLPQWFWGTYKPQVSWWPPREEEGHPLPSLGVLLHEVGLVETFMDPVLLPAVLFHYCSHCHQEFRRAAVIVSMQGPGKYACCGRCLDEGHGGGDICFPCCCNEVYRTGELMVLAASGDAQVKDLL